MKLPVTLVWCLVMASAAALVAGCGSEHEASPRAAVSGATGDGCTAATGPFRLPSGYATRMFSVPVESELETEAVTQDRLSEMGLPAHLGDVPASAVGSVDDGNGTHYGTVMYVDGDPDGMTRPELFDRGGILVEVTPAAASETGRSLDGLLPGRLVPVRIGSVTGRLSWADPDSTGARSYAVSYVDGDRAILVWQRAGPADAVDSARAIACATG
ncbi:hypothetical protein H5V45_10265 [Nocardioides sp. KIGAM211]|uniref:Uncharacterized protein n=1 Tax=Nocardioides luti TaxID=2761101 RepID=A0A7X0VAF4_9ACTN|nr:hypothetical protein [Nocardioides luti]MBB6627704.1 hypothetical protein [Nocardioides luti]